MTDFDSPWKEALDRYFPSFMALLFPDMHTAIDWSRNFEMLDKELQQVVREAESRRRQVDKLVKVWRKDGVETWILIHIEVQSQEEKDFPRRMYVYNYRLFDRYNRTVVSLAVLADDNPEWRPHEFWSSLWGCKAGIEFPAAKLLEYGADETALEKSDNLFAILVLAHLKTLQTRKSPENRKIWKMRIVRRLYERGLPRREIQEMFRFLDWIMELPKALSEDFWNEMQEFEKEKKMPYVTSVERIGMEKGLEKGREEGWEKGQKVGELIGLRKALAVTLESKFGAPGKKLLPRIRRIDDADALLTLQRTLSGAVSLDDFRRALP